MAPSHNFVPELGHGGAVWEIPMPPIAKAVCKHLSQAASIVAMYPRVFTPPGDRAVFTPAREFLRGGKNTTQGSHSAPRLAMRVANPG